MKHLRASSVRSSAIGVESILMKSALLIWVIFGAAFFSYPILAAGVESQLITYAKHHSKGMHIKIDVFLLTQWKNRRMEYRWSFALRIFIRL